MTKKQSRQLVVRRTAITTEEEVVKDFLRWFIEPYAPLVSVAETKDFFSQVLRAFTQSLDEARMDVIALAKVGYGPAIEVLRAVLMEYKSRGIPLPWVELAEYDLWVRGACAIARHQ
jgi:hypothetical protein